MQLRKERSKNVKKQTRVYILSSFNSVALFIYGPKVNTISREYDKRVLKQSFLFETQGQLHPLNIENFLIKTFQKNRSLNLFIVQIL